MNWNSSFILLLTINNATSLFKFFFLVFFVLCECSFNWMWFFPNVAFSKIARLYVVVEITSRYGFFLRTLPINGILFHLVTYLYSLTYMSLLVFLSTFWLKKAAYLQSPKSLKQTLFSNQQVSPFYQLFPSKKTVFSISEKFKTRPFQ